ncbi:hypothetical protein HPB49_020911 [Dermacentor silvarum]|uniref:Uncharacterized protein n=1 Tax=Dermacentor silvarum TaxID=543639 RepID=A0ACB8DGF7_DERSI|nr:hypothetical protein HPB49_020911 [Dermacentor silvarum]
MLENRGPKPDVATTRRLSSLTDTPGGLLVPSSREPPLSKILCTSRSALYQSGASTGTLIPCGSADVTMAATSLAVSNAPHDLTSVAHASTSAHEKSSGPRYASQEQSETAARRLVIDSLNSQKSSLRSPPEVNADALKCFKYIAEGRSSDCAHLERSNKSTVQVAEEDSGGKAATEYALVPSYTRSDFVGSPSNTGVAASSPGEVGLHECSGITAASSLQASTSLHTSGRQQQGASRDKPLIFPQPRSSESFVIQGHCESASRTYSEAATGHGVSLRNLVPAAIRSERVVAHPRAVSDQVRGVKELKNELLLEDPDVTAGFSRTGLGCGSVAPTSRPLISPPAEEASSKTINQREELPAAAAIIRAGPFTLTSKGETLTRSDASRRATNEANQAVAAENHPKYLAPSFAPSENSPSSKKPVVSEASLLLSDTSESTELSSQATAPLNPTTYRFSGSRAHDAPLLVPPEKKQSKLSRAGGGEASSDSDVSAKRSSQRSTEDSPSRQKSKTTAQTPHQVEVPASARDMRVYGQAELPAATECLLYPVAVCLAFVLITVLALLFLPAHWPSFWNKSTPRTVKGRSSVTCKSIGCLQNALYLSTLLSWDSKKPCTDFYAFVCLRWTNTFSSPFESSISTDDDYVAFLEARVHASLRDNYRNSKALRPLKDLYEKCGNYETIEKSGWSALTNLLTEVFFVDFPLTPQTSTNISVWKIAAELLRKTGTDALLSVGVAFHPVFAAIDIASIGPPELMTKRNVGIEEAVPLYATAIFWASRFSQGRSSWPSVAAATEKFAGDIERLAQLRTKGSRAQVQTLPTRSPLMKFLSEAFGGFQVSFFSVATPAVLIRSPDLVGLIVNMVERTEMHIVVNYLGLRLMIQVAPFLPYSGLNDINGAFIYGKRTTGAPRSRLCVRAVERALFPAVHVHLFAETKLNKLASALVNIVHIVVDEFNAVVDDSLLFDNQSKKAIKHILRKTDFQVLLPGWTKNAALVQMYLDSLPAVNVNRSALSTYIDYHQRTFVYALERGAGQRWSGSAFSDDCWHESHPWTVYVPLLTFNGTQVLDKGLLDAMQLSRLAPRLGRCLFNMLLEVADSKKDHDHWLTDNTWRNLLDAESIFKQQLVDLRFGHLRDVLASRTAFRVFKKIVASSDVADFTVMRKEGGVFTSAQMFFASLMLQNCEVSGRPRRVRPSADGEKWSMALRNTKEYAETFNCSLETHIN